MNRGRARWGAALAAVDERHISIDALSKFLPEKVRHGARVVTSLFAMVVCLVLADASITLLRDEMDFGGELVLGLPSWVGVVILPPGYLLMALHFLIRAIESIVVAAGGMRRGKRPDGAPPCRSLPSPHGVVRRAIVHHHRSHRGVEFQVRGNRFLGGDG